MIHSKLRTLTWSLVIGAAVAAGTACSRTDRTADNTAATENAAAIQRDRDEYVTKMEQRISELERKLADMKTAPSATKRAVSNERIEDLQESLKDLRSEVADLRSRTADNWWPATERSVERSAKSIESDVERARGANRARTDQPAPAATGEADRMAPDTDFATRRDQFVSRMESQIASLEQDLNSAAARGRRAGEVDDVRKELNDLKEEVREMRTVSAENWWDATKKRLDRSFERIEDAIENADDNAGDPAKR